MGYIPTINTTIKPGLIAYSERINAIQQAVQNGVISEIIDMEGSAFVLGSDPDALIMSPVVSTIDQQHTVGNGWLNLKDVFVIEEMPLTKTGIQKIELYFRNTGGSNVTISGEIRDNNLLPEEEIGNLITDFQIVIPGNTGETKYTVLLELDNLQLDSYYVLINRTNVSTVDIRVDESGGYIGELRVSPDKSAWDPSDSSLKFTEHYTTLMACDVKPEFAVINGSRIFPKATHVKLAMASGYGDRKDIVTLDEDGYFSVIQGQAGSKPVYPEDQVSSQSLIIAHVFVPKNVSNIKQYVIDQDDSNDVNRERSVLEKLRRLKIKQDWDWEHNKPERIQATLAAGAFMDTDECAGGSHGCIIQTGDYYKLATTGSMVITETLADLDDIDTTASTCTIDTVKRRARCREGAISERQVIGWFEELPNPGFEPSINGWTHLVRYGVPTGGLYVAQYPMWSSVNIGPDTTLGYLMVQIDATRNVRALRVVAFDPATKEIIETSSPTDASKVGVESGWTKFIFSNTKMWGENTRMWFALVAQVDNNFAGQGEVDFRTWEQDLGYKNRGYLFALQLAPQPFNPKSVMTSGVNNYPTTIWNNRKLRYAAMGNYRAFINGTQLVSRTYDVGVDFTSVVIDANFTVQDKSSYRLYVSNDGGDTWYKATSNKVTFTNAGSQFKYKIIFSTSTPERSSSLNYVAADGYAIKFTLGTGSVTPPPTSGTIVTVPFDGSAIVENIVDVSGKFSHFEFLQLFSKFMDGDITVDIQHSDNGTDWEDWKTGLNLIDDFGKVAIDFDEAIDDDEYNYYCRFPEKAFYWQYARMKIHLSREDPYTISPRVSGIGSVVRLV